MKKKIREGVRVDDAWRELVTQWNTDVAARFVHRERQSFHRWRLDEPQDLARWHRTGNGLSDAQASKAGEFAIASRSDRALVGIYPSGVFSHRLSAKHAARLTSEDVRIDGDYQLWVRAIGDGGASTRFVVYDYPRKGVVFPTTDLKNQWQWIQSDLSYWSGDLIHIELATGPDAPLLVKNEPRSWFGVREIMILPKGDSPPHEANEMLDAWIEVAYSKPPTSLEEAADQLVSAVNAAINAWVDASITDSQATLLDACLQQGVLSNDLQKLVNAKELIEEYHRLEEEIAVPTRVPSLEETVARTQSLYIRGDHKNPGAIVPRAFLSAIDGHPYETAQSGRLQLAEDLVRADNPLTRRVIANRIWHHLFGRGIVASPDNFGRLGQLPSHPELLDYLATTFVSKGDSIKEMIRLLVTSKTWQLASRPSTQSEEVDPDNYFLSHTHVRRLEAEAIRDSLLLVSGGLNLQLFGEPVNGDSNRRSVYMRVTRNALDPFLRAFDFPEPFSTVGRRDVTNVPAQSLTLMNDERVASLAAAWAKRVVEMKLPSDEDRIRSMFIAGLGRPAKADEIQRAQSYFLAFASKQADAAKQCTELQTAIEKRRKDIEVLIGPVRSRLLDDSTTKSSTAGLDSFRPIARWEFDDSSQDVLGSAHAEVHAGAQIAEGALILNTKGYAVTKPLQQTLTEKTIEAWVQLDTLDQRGGGVMTIQSTDGATFDAIVFAEKSPNQWLAGSNRFSRTQTFNGPSETEAAKRAVHFAIAYHADGRVAGYRDGAPYGEAYQSDGPYEFKSGETVVSFGVRHLPAHPNRMLGGRILRAQLYDRALTSEEIQASSASKSSFVSETQIVAALSQPERKLLDTYRVELAGLEAQLNELRPTVESSDEFSVWTDLARAIFTFKEFLFVK